ncbi:hypothetical protein SAY86_007320 [Trapa natans]|uniref:Uncharacterized protein n=1 Tax=Trapa natans TaxID=22666 RepID=A0AAN7LLM9_TRANT|nr:hypothetical protein SAY86_007320 [Trapa natans]
MCLFNKDCYCRFNVHCNLSSKPIPSQANRDQKPMNLAKEGVLFLRLFEEKQEIRGQQEDEVKSVAHAMIYVHSGPPCTTMLHGGTHLSSWMRTISCLIG